MTIISKITYFAPRNPRVVRGYINKRLMTEKIKKMIESMTVDEMKQRLAEYMAADQQLAPRPRAVEVRPSNINNVRCRYDVLLIAENGQETEVKFRDRYSRLVYIFTLLHPQGYQRRLAAANGYKTMRQLYTLLYFKGSDALLKTIESTDFDHFFSHYIAQSRNAIRQATPHAADFAIDRPQSHDGKVLIPFVAQGGTVILDNALRNQMSHL